MFDQSEDCSVQLPYAILVTKNQVEKSTGDESLVVAGTSGFDSVHVFAVRRQRGVHQ